MSVGLCEGDVYFGSGVFSFHWWFPKSATANILILPAQFRQPIVVVSVPFLEEPVFSPLCLPLRGLHIYVWWLSHDVVPLFKLFVGHCILGFSTMG